ncbi:MAG: very short patch repair endonuclease [Acidobacteriia bacterium]|nr:very short patch repair endonuclease [Terriglobia bacterium]
MADNRSPESRSALMSRIHGKDTAPELLVRQLLHGLGYRFRLHRRSLPGTPDIVFPSRQKAIFVNGCFWHAHGCRIGRSPKSRLEFWQPKLERTRARDTENKADLRRIGWTVLTIWQCQTRAPEKLANKLVSFLGPAGKIQPSVNFRKRDEIRSVRCGR